MALGKKKLEHVLVDFMQDNQINGINAKSALQKPKGQPPT